RIDMVAVGLAEKLVARNFERVRRDASRRDPATIERLERQIGSALAWLEALRPSPWLYGAGLTRADITAAVAFTYLREKPPDLPALEPPAVLAALCARCEALGAFAHAAYA